MRHAIQSAIVALMAVAWAMTGVGQVDRTIDVQELVPIAESFCQLAMWDAHAAGEVWMSEQALQTWEQFIGVALPNQIAMLALFSHTVLMGVIADDGTPIAGLVDPWTGTLIVLSFSQDAASINAVAIVSLTPALVGGSDATQVAMNLMSAINEASDRFDAYLPPTRSFDNDTAEWQAVADRLVTRSAQLQLAYPESETADPALQLSQETIEAIQAGQLSDLTSVIEDADALWMQSLLPVYAVKVDGVLVVALASSVESLDLVWLRISDSALLEVSWIRLFDAVTTRSGGAS